MKGTRWPIGQSAESDDYVKGKDNGEEKEHDEELDEKKEDVGVEAVSNWPTASAAAAAAAAATTAAAGTATAATATAATAATGAAGEAIYRCTQPPLFLRAHSHICYFLLLWQPTLTSSWQVIIIVFLGPVRQ